MDKVDFLTTIDIREKSNKVSLLEEYKREEGNSKFDLSKGPLIKVKLVRVEEEEYVLLMTMHHIISDGWSIGIINKELSYLYNRYLSGKSSDLGDLEV